jgi:hypothetical protein
MKVINIIVLLLGFSLLFSCSETKKESSGENDVKNELEKAQSALEKIDDNTDLVDSIQLRSKEFETLLNKLTSNSSEKLSISDIDSLSNNKINFNKIEPLPFANKSLIPAGDTIGLKVMIAAYDSTDEMKLKYWIKDSLEQ